MDKEVRECAVSVDEMKLHCAIYGEGTVFSVTIARDAEVGALQEAIFCKKRYDRQETFDASMLTLFLARKDGVWLKDEESLDSLLSGKIDTSYNKMRSTWKLNNPAYFGKDFHPGDEEIQILVEIPRERQSLDPRLVQLYERLLRHVLLDAPSSTSIRSDTFKKRLCEAYDCNGTDGMLRCMLLDTALPSELVIASHLFRHKNARFAEELIAVSDIDDVRNGLLLFKPLEHAFDHFQISFVYHERRDAFLLQIVDPSVRYVRLFDQLDDQQRTVLLQGQALPTDWRTGGPRFAPGTAYDIQTTFGDLEGRTLSFHNTLERPYKRCLNLQARLARANGIENEWIASDEGDFDDFWSEGMSLAQKMQRHFAHQERDDE